MKRLLSIFLFVPCLLGAVQSDKRAASMLYVQRAKQTLDSLYSKYSVANTSLLRENYPFDQKYSATYLANETHVSNQFSYLWPFSGTFSAVNALYEATGDTIYRSLLYHKVMPGLEEYLDSVRKPDAYSSYVRSAGLSDRFYDDNIWLGIDFVDTYMLTKDPLLIGKAKLVWRFIESGMDGKLGGGIYWCEQKKTSKNTCSNAPGAVLALKLFEATQDSSYYWQGRALYEWTKASLQDSTDYLYFDHVALDGKIGKAKYAYNSGQMLQAASLLYQFTKDQHYLADAQKLANACYLSFFYDFTPSSGGPFKLLKEGNIWFKAVMLRGFIELYRLDGNRIYLNAFIESLDYAWDHARDGNGLFSTDLSGKQENARKWLLTEAAIIEMYARLSILK